VFINVCKPDPIRFAIFKYDIPELDLCLILSGRWYETPEQN